jgi:hypothetical protein
MNSDYNCQVIDTLFFPSITNGIKFIEYLNQATKSINICIFSLTSDNITNVLIELHNKGIKI